MATQGRRWKPTDEDRQFVERAVKAGMTIEAIAECLNVHDDTLRKHCRYEITTARGKLVTKAIGVLDDALTDGSLDASKYVLSRVAGWSERTEHTGKDGAPVQVNIMRYAGDNASE